jgi:SAM-dependent methyltransferase
MHPDYLLDVAYTSHFYETLNPWLINYVCAINGYPARDLAEGFDYCELGCGNGLSLNILAAANSKGRFRGVDFNPAHVKNARLTMTEGGLSNVTFLEENFAHLSHLDLPDFDFITLHGVFSWISPEMRNAIASFIGRKLKPGGMAMVSYNTPQGWAIIAPMRDFLRSFIDDRPGDLLEKAKQGLDDLRFLRDSGAAFFKINPLASTMLDSYLQLDLRYIVHEFLTPHWEPLNFSEVLGTMGRAGVEFAGSIPVALNYGQISIPPELHDYFQKIPSRLAFQMRKDLVNMTLFRSDVYCKAKRDPKIAYLDRLRGMIFGTALRAKDFKFKFDLPTGSSINMEGPLFERLAARIGASAITLDVLLTDPELVQDTPEGIVSAVEWLVATDQLKPYARPSPNADDAREKPFRLSEFNRALLLRELPRRKSVPLASWTAGSGIAVGRKDGLALLAISEAGPQGAEAWAGLWTVRNPGGVDDGGSALPLSEIIQKAASDPDYCAALGLDGPPDETT